MEEGWSDEGTTVEDESAGLKFDTEDCGPDAARNNRRQSQ